MFLDDKLYEIGMSKGPQPSHWNDKSVILENMLSEVQNYMDEQTDNGRIDPRDLDNSIKRITQYWRNAVNKMHKSGLTFINPEGLVLTSTREGNNVDIEINYT